MLSVHVVLYVLMMILIYIFAYIDYRKKRSAWQISHISFIVPCYNDGDSVWITIKSIYESCVDLTIDVVVVNDKSTDNSFEVLQNLQKEYNFLLIQNPHNMGKVQTLNNNIYHLQSDIFFVIDADVTLNTKAVKDLLSRFSNDPRIGWVSCPYIPTNGGFFARMQRIEYNMLMIIQWSYNIFSAISLWGGCLAVRRDAFEQAGRFSINAITEDMDLAFKLNKYNWKVQQSFVAIHSIVPDTLRTRYKQKIRWNSGGTQAFLTYMSIWIKNPLHVAVMFLFNFLMFFSAYQFFQTITGIYNIWDIMTFKIFLNMFGILRGDTILRDALRKWSFMLLSFPYIIPLLQKRTDWYKVFLLIPFSLIYIPVYTIVGFVWAFVGFKRYRELQPWVRAW